MRHGIIITTGAPTSIAELAAEAEAAGWDGVFYWDAIHIEAAGPIYDPWVVLAAMAMRTRSVRIGAIITPLARRRPWKVARETVSLDHLSNGRLVLAVGLGALDDGGFGKVGEATDRRTRAERLDESLAILTGLWTGQPFSFEGRHYHLDEMTFVPRPIQQPRIPIWVVGAWPSRRSMRRALAFDGVLPHTLGGASMGPDTVREIVDHVDANRTAPGPFEVVVEGKTPADDPQAAVATVEPWAAAGATWWMEADWSAAGAEAVRARIRPGPPGGRAAGREPGS